MNFFDYIEDSNIYLSERQRKVYDRLLILLKSTNTEDSYINKIKKFYEDDNIFFIEFLLSFNFSNLDNNDKQLLIIDCLNQFENLDLNYKNKFRNILNIK